MGGIMRVIVGYERSGRIRAALRARGYDAWSCDLMPADDGDPHHFQCSIFEVLDMNWDLGIFHPDCTYLTCSAEWAYKDPDFERYPGVGYHQKLKPGTLFGAERRAARDKAVDEVLRLQKAPIPFKATENPRGVLSTRWRPFNQSVQPNWFGDDASKELCWWTEGPLPLLSKTVQIPPRMVNGRPRWGNQTDTGQNRLPPSDDRARKRAETYPGVADAIASQWGDYVAIKLGKKFPSGGMHLSDPMAFKGAKRAGA